MMRPTTALDALTAAKHDARQTGHRWEPACCGSEPLDRLEAQDDLDALGDLGFMVVPAVQPPKSVPRGVESTTLVLTDFTEQVLALLRELGPLSTWELNSIYAGRSEDRPNWYPRRAFDTPRKRLSEFAAAGLARDTGVTRLHHGVGYRVWEITPKGADAVTTERAA